MGTLSNNGITVEFTSETLLRAFKLMTIDERVIRGRFWEGVFAVVYSRDTCNPPVKFAVLWDEGRKKPYLFKLQMVEDDRWQVLSVVETCAGHSFAEGFVLKRHVDHAANVFYFFQRQKKAAGRNQEKQSGFPVLRPGAV